ncbi:hypothetical protein C8J57DRAFT_1293856 [Mycena rebaudengoi]|nr:hypothetical protein C8J57DRAFT_1293856 [Mycena rebaudengoi]
MSLLIRALSRSSHIRHLNRVQFARRPLFSSSSRRHSRPGYFHFLDDIPENTVLWGILGLNGAVFALSYYAKQKLKVERDASLVRSMMKHFYASWQNVSAGRVWTLFTSTFTHMDLPHILFNSITFYFMAPSVLYMLGSRQFLFLYLGGGAVAELLAMAYTNIIRKRDPPSVGASAAIYSILSFAACAVPRSTLLLYGIIPLPMWMAVSGIFAYDTYRTATDKGGTTNTAAHTAGLMAGASYFLLKRFRIF